MLLLLTLQGSKRRLLFVPSIARLVQHCVYLRSLPSMQIVLSYTLDYWRNLCVNIWERYLLRWSYGATVMIAELLSTTSQPIICFNSKYRNFTEPAEELGRCLGLSKNEGNEMCQSVLQMNGRVVLRWSLHRLCPNDLNVSNASEIRNCAHFDEDNISQFVTFPEQIFRFKILRAYDQYALGQIRVIPRSRPWCVRESK